MFLAKHTPALLCLALTTAELTAAPTFLQYETQSPVMQQSRVSIEVTQQLADKTYRLKAYQEEEAELKLHSVSKPPYEATLVLKKLGVGMNNGHQEVVFSSDGSETSPLLAEVEKVVNLPVRFSIGDQLQILSEDEALIRLANRLEPLNGFNLQRLFSQMFYHLFALANTPLEVGQTYERSLQLAPKTPVVLKYQIVGITTDEVRATIAGEVENAPLAFTQGILRSGAHPTTLKVSGKIDGKAVWSRQNALIYKTRIHSQYEGTVLEEGREHSFAMSMLHTDSTRS